jgi:hypothetical protein
MIPPSSLAFSLLILATASPLLADSLLGELNPTQQSTIKSGSQILITEDINGNAWPRVTIYQKVDASPEEVAAVFFDYDDGKSYLPNLLKSEISKRITPCTMEIDYGVDVPILPDEFYTVRNTIRFLSPDHYRFDWKLVRAVQTKDSVGSFCIEPLDGKTLIRYQNLVTPGSSMAGLLRKVAISQMKGAATAIACQAEKLKAANPTHLEKQVEALRAAFKAE